MTPQVRSARRIAMEIRQSRTELAVARARSDTTGIMDAEIAISASITSIRSELSSAMSAEAAVRTALSLAQAAVSSSTSGLSSAQSALSSALSSVGTAEMSLQTAINSLLASPDLGLALKVSGLRDSNNWIQLGNIFLRRAIQHCERGGSQPGGCAREQIGRNYWSRYRDRRGQ